MDEVLKAAAKQIHRPSHHHVELALRRVPKKPIKLGPPIAASSGAIWRPPKADIVQHGGDVRFVPKADITVK